MASLQDFANALMQTWPARMGKDMVQGAMAPGDAYQSTPENPVTTEQMIGPAANLAGMVMGGSYAGVPAKAAGEAALGAGPIRAYHGSPYNFDKFDLAKIGEGQGAQSYGHGLYFAENEATAKSYKPAGGSMYEVGINAKPEQFLDWEKPFSMQSQQVQKSVSNILGEIKPQSSDLARGYDIYGQTINRGLDTTPSIYRDDRLLWGGQAKKKPIASSMLNEAGIPGIKYLDQGSRGLGEGTSNYVVFDPKIVEILRKYGIAATTPLGAAYASQLMGSDHQ